MTEDLKQGTRLGDNELVLRIGRGGMATVWVARERSADPKEDRLVAVKAMLNELADEPEFVRMFIDEVRLVRSIRHPNVVDVYEVGETDGIMWMSMEWVEGEALHAVIAEAGKRRAIPPDIAVRIIADVASGLHAAHEARDSSGRLLGVVHRDVSPHNILIGRSGVVKLVDFGVAKAIGRMSESTRVGQLKGKFGYMSPEQALGRSVDRRSDVFSLGIVLFELTTSRRLFRGETDVETLKLVVSGQIPTPSSIDPTYPRELERIVLRALERDPKRRYATAADLELDLTAYLKAERVVVAQAGIAGLLKRVVGSRVEQRRKAIRAALRALGTKSNPLTSELLSAEPAFTPTGRDRITLTGVSSVSGDSSPKEAFSDASDERHRRKHKRVRRSARMSWAGAFGYSIGVAGIVIAIIVLFFLRR
jgi:serine/threonine-protein kinase